jgi:hypothetical protein
MQRSLRTCLLHSVIPNLKHSEFILSQLINKRYPNAQFLKVTHEIPLHSPTYEFPEAIAWSVQKFSPQAYTHEFPEVNTRSSNMQSNGVSYRESNMYFYVVRQDKAAKRVLHFFTNVCRKDPLDTHHV